MRDRPLVRRLTLLCTLAALALGTYLLGRFLSVRGMVYAGAFGGIAAFAVVLAQFLTPLFARLWGSPTPDSSLSVAQAADNLAATLNSDWVRDETMRRVNTPRPLPVRWDITSTARDAMHGRYLQPSERSRFAVSENLSGNFYDILSLFSRIPSLFPETTSSRLVILGSVGAGKSILAQKLAHDLLAERSDDQAVPVILPAASWNPAHDLFTWVAEWLTDSYPGLSRVLRTPAGEVITVARALVETGKILPIIDGLDELPEYVRAAAIAAVNAAGSDIPLVVTSRPAEYLHAIAESQHPVAQALAIELLPLDINEVKAYLQDAVPAGNWGKVFSRGLPRMRWAGKARSGIYSSPASWPICSRQPGIPAPTC